MCATSFRFKLKTTHSKGCTIMKKLLTIVISSWSLILTGLSPSLAYGALNKQEGFNRENHTDSHLKQSIVLT